MATKKSSKKSTKKKSLSYGERALARRRQRSKRLEPFEDNTLRDAAAARLLNLTRKADQDKVRGYGEGARLVADILTSEEWYAGKGPPRKELEAMANRLWNIKYAADRHRKKEAAQGKRKASSRQKKAVSSVKRSPKKR